MLRSSSFAKATADVLSYAGQGKAHKVSCQDRAAEPTRQRSRSLYHAFIQASNFHSPKYLKPNKKNTLSHLRRSIHQAMHPSEKFIAPNTILTGVPLKQLIDTKLVALIAESFAAVDRNFDVKAFIHAASQGLETFELKDRARHIAHALHAQLPQDIGQACEIVIQSFGAKLEVTQDYGLAPFYYMPHSEWIGLYAVADFDSGMRANYELTQRYTAEFSIRPFVIEHESTCLQELDTWCQDSNPHVRRLVSEGTRSRLPWAMRLKNIQVKPALSLPLLEQLKDDPELYVRRSVANHLGDIAKDHLELVLTTCNRWLEESQAMQDLQAAKKRRWIIRHALRYPAKKGSQSALNIRLAAK